MAAMSFLKNVLHKSPKSSHKQGDAAAVHIQQANTVEITDSPRLTGAQSEINFYRYLFDTSNAKALSVPQKLVLEVVKNNLGKKKHREQAIPRLPMVIPKLLRSLRDPDSSVKDYVDVVNKDPVMSAAVLKLANSVYFNPIGTRIDHIERAIVKLGIDGLRSVLSAAVMHPIIQRDSPYYSQTGQRLWHHALHCAVACELIGGKRKSERFKVYLLGLIHDIGKITIFSEVCKQLKLNGDDDPSFRAFAPLMKKYAARLSYQIACDWQLPEEICIGLHDQINISHGDQVSEYGKLLYEANICCEMFATTHIEKRSALNFLIQDFETPSHLFEKLSEVTTQL